MDLSLDRRSQAAAPRLGPNADGLRFNKEPDVSTRPHNGWWQASNNVPRRWLDQLKANPSVDAKLAVSAAPRLRVLDGRLQPI